MPQEVHASGQELVLPVFNRILLVTDFSLCSEAAAPVAQLMADSYGSAITVAHVVAPVQHSGEDAEGERHSAEARMERFIAANSLTQESAVVRAGPLQEALEAVIREDEIDLVVVGTHGRSGVGKLVMGSAAQKIFNIASCPVLSVSPRGRAAKKPARVLYATDFGERSLKALPYALSLANRTAAELILLHVPKDSGKDAETASQVYHERLRDLIPSKARSWCRFDTVVFAGDPAEVIVDVAQVQNIDVVVIGAHAVEGPFYSINVPLTTAYRVVAHAQCPVLRVRS